MTLQFFIYFAPPNQLLSNAKQRIGLFLILERSMQLQSTFIPLFVCFILAFKKTCFW